MCGFYNVSLNRTDSPYITISNRSIPYLFSSAIDRGSRNRIRINTVAQMFAPRYHRVPVRILTTTAAREFNGHIIQNFSVSATVPRAEPAIFVSRTCCCCLSLGFSIPRNGRERGDTIILIESDRPI